MNITQMTQTQDIKEVQNTQGALANQISVTGKKEIEKYKGAF